MLFAFGSNFTYAVAGSLLRRWLARGRRLLWFNRTLAVVLLATAGWMLTASSIPATVSETDDGRIRLDFVNPRPDEIAVLIKAKRRTR